MQNYKLAILSLLLAAAYFSLAPRSVGDPPPPGGGTNNTCTNCPTTSNGLPSVVERYGYYVHLQWTNASNSAVVFTSWSSTNYSNACSMVPTSHVCVVSNGVPLQQDNTNTLAHEPSIFSNGTNVVAIFWAPNAFSFKRGFKFNGLESGSWLEIPGTAPTNTAKDPTVPDPWWPITFTGPIARGNNFFKVRRMDNGLGWTNVCQ